MYLLPLKGRRAFGPLAENFAFCPLLGVSGRASMGYLAGMIALDRRHRRGQKAFEAEHLSASVGRMSHCGGRRMLAAIASAHDSGVSRQTRAVVSCSAAPASGGISLAQLEPPRPNIGFLHWPKFKRGRQSIRRPSPPVRWVSLARHGFPPCVTPSIALRRAPSPGNRGIAVATKTRD